MLPFYPLSCFLYILSAVAKTQGIWPYNFVVVRHAVRRLFIPETRDDGKYIYFLVFSIQLLLFLTDREIPHYSSVELQDHRIIKTGGDLWWSLDATLYLKL